MLELIATLLLAAHLILLGVAMIGPLASAWFDWRAARGADCWLEKLAGQLACCALVGLIGGSVLGGVLLAMRYGSDDRYWQALHAIPADRVWFAGAELLFSLGSLSIYVAMWNVWRRWRFVHRLLAVACATNLMMHFPALFTIVSVVSTRPGGMGRMLERADFRRLLIDPEVMSRVVHVWLASVAITGLAIVWLALLNRQASATFVARVVRSGSRMTLTAVMLQFAVGLWVTAALAEPARSLLLGDDPMATLLFLASVMLAMGQLHVLAPLALGAPTMRQAAVASMALALLMFLMVGVRVRVEHQLRLPVRQQLPSSSAAAPRARLASIAGIAPTCHASDERFK